MNIGELFEWFKLNYPMILEEWKNCSHYYSPQYPNPYHMEDSLLIHNEMVLNQGKEKQISSLGAIACLFHDLGKPVTRKENHEKKRVSMIAHESVSGFMAIEYLEKLGEKISLSTQDKINIFLAICYHIDFHRVMATCLSKDKADPERYSELVAKYQGMGAMCRVLVELGVCDSLGRETDSEISPIHPELETLIGVLDKQNVYEKMTREKVEAGSKPVVEMLIGIPCSGKSTYCGSKKDFVILSRDGIIMEQGQGKTYEEAYKEMDKAKVNEEFDKRMKSCIRAKENVILDMTNGVKSRRKATLSQFKAYHKKAVVFLEELPVIYARNEERSKAENKIISQEVFLTMMMNFTPPSYEEFDEIVFIYKGQECSL